MFKIIFVLVTAVLWALVASLLNPDGDPTLFLFLFVIAMILGAVAVFGGDEIDQARKERKR